MREWLVIGKTAGRSVFATEEMRQSRGYIPRDVVEGELGIKVESEEGRCTWFRREDCERMRAHPEWRETEPE